MEHELWNLKVREYDVVTYTQRFNELSLMCPRTVKPERVKVDAYIRGLTDNIKARDARILEGKKRKWESFQGGNSCGKGNQRQGNARAMVTNPTEGKLPLCEQYFTRHVGPCMIRCHKCGKVGHKAWYYKEKSVSIGANAQPVWTCYDCSERGHTRNRCPKKIKQEEVGEVHGQAYAIKDDEPQGPNVVTGTFLLNNRYAFVLFDSGSDKSFVDTRFSSMLNINPIKIGASYEVELVDGRYGLACQARCRYCLWRESFSYTVWNKMLRVESDKGVSRLKVISCINARKYVERGCYLFLAHVTENKSKEKRMEDVPIIHDFLEVFPEELPGLPQPRQVEFRIDLVPGASFSLNFELS
ncbi:putative reverse transcriptase domain-containing protein [Tanacetum coccineum]